MKNKKGIVLGVANKMSIAWACAQELAAQGAEIAFNYLGDAQEKRLRELLVEMPGAQAYPCDVTRDEEIAEFFSKIGEKWGEIDFIVHSIAYADKEALKGDFVNTTRAQYLNAMDVSAYSLVGVSRAALPYMKKGGSIVCMSYYGAEKVIPHYNVMGVAKAALECTTRYLAWDLGTHGIRVNAISAGAIKTLSSSAIPGLKGMLADASRHSPLRRNVTASDVGQSTLFLLSDMSANITGEVLHVDSGANIMGLSEAEKEN